MRRLIIAAPVMPALTATIVGTLLRVSPSNRANSRNNHGSASARFGKNSVHPTFLSSQTSTPWEPES